MLQIMKLKFESLKNVIKYEYEFKFIKYVEVLKIYKNATKLI